MRNFTSLAPKSQILKYRLRKNIKTAHKSAEIHQRLRSSMDNRLDQHSHSSVDRNAPQGASNTYDYKNTLLDYFHVPCSLTIHPQGFVDDPPP